MQESNINIKLLKPITSDNDLIELAEHLNIHLDGIFLLSEITKPLPKIGSYLILLEKPELSIGHWVAVYNNTYSDSMGAAPPEVLKIKNYIHKQWQGTYSNYCGIWALLYLYAKQKNKMYLFDQFKNLNNSDFE
jgi:hypothetical protein